MNNRSDLKIPTRYDGSIVYGTNNGLCINWGYAPRDNECRGNGAPIKWFSDGLYEGLWERRPLVYGSLEDGSSEYIQRIEMAFIDSPYASFGGYLRFNPQTINTIISTKLDKS